MKIEVNKTINTSVELRDAFNAIKDVIKALNQLRMSDMVGKKVSINIKIE